MYVRKHDSSVRLYVVALFIAFIKRNAWQCKNSRMCYQNVVYTESKMINKIRPGGKWIYWIVFQHIHNTNMTELSVMVHLYPGCRIVRIKSRWSTYDVTWSAAESLTSIGKRKRSLRWYQNLNFFLTLGL